MGYATREHKLIKTKLKIYKVRDYNLTACLGTQLAAAISIQNEIIGNTVNIKKAAKV
jgi:hypothetical protein